MSQKRCYDFRQWLLQYATLIYCCILPNPNHETYAEFMNPIQELIWLEIRISRLYDSNQYFHPPLSSIDIVNIYSPIIYVLYFKKERENFYMVSYWWGISTSCQAFLGFRALGTCLGRQPTALHLLCGLRQLRQSTSCFVICI